MRIHLTNDYSLKLVLSAAKANNDCPWVTAYVPSDNPQPAMGIGNTNGVTAVEIVPAPGTDVGTSVRSVIIQNDDTKETTFKLQITNGTTTKEFSKTVAVGARLDLLAEDSLVTDHGELTGKSDDDHTQYLLVAGTRAFTGDQSMGDNALTGIKKTVFTAATEKTVSSGTLTVDQGVHKVQPESGTADDIATISGMTANSSMTLFVSDAGTDTLTLKHGTGNISCFTGADIELSTGFVLCYYDGTTVYVSGASWVLDEDDMASDSATKVPTQQSVKKYVDDKVGGLSPTTVGARDLSGFPNRTDTTLSIDGSGNFTIAPTGASFVVWNNGTSYTKTSEVVQVTADNDETYIYYDAGVLTKSTTVWDIADGAAPVAIVFKTGSSYAPWDERHAHNRDRNWHEWAHRTIGARYQSGFAGVFDNTTFSVAAGTFYDEDIDHVISGTQTACRLWYRNAGAGSMTFESNVTTPYKAIASALQYDLNGTITPVSNNQYSSQWVYASPDPNYPIYVVVGQSQSNTLVGARSQSAPALPGLATAEWKLLYQVIYRNAGGTPTYIEAIDYRQVSTGPATNATVASHTALTDRDAADSHPATAISVDTTNFDNNLSSADDTVQKALETLDELTADGGGKTLGFYGYLASDQTGLSDDTEYDVNLTADVDPESGWSAVNDEYTVPATYDGKKCFVSARLQVNDVTQNNTCYIYIKRDEGSGYATETFENVYSLGFSGIRVQVLLTYRYVFTASAGDKIKMTAKCTSFQNDSEFESDTTWMMLEFGD